MIVGLVSARSAGQIGKKADREFGEGEVEILFGGGFEDLARSGWRFRLGCWRLWGEDDDVEFGCESGDEMCRRR